MQSLIQDNSFNSCDHLLTLRLSKNKLSQILSLTLAGLDITEALEIGCMSVLIFIAPDAFCYVPNLKILKVSYVKSAEIPCVAPCAPGLVLLNCMGCKIEEINETCLAPLSNLSSLNIFRNPGLHLQKAHRSNFLHQLPVQSYLPVICHLISFIMPQMLKC